MKFKLLVNPDIDEAVQASVHKRSDFTEKLEQLVMAYNGADSITAYADGEMKLIGFKVTSKNSYSYSQLSLLILD